MLVGACASVGSSRTDEASLGTSSTSVTSTSVLPSSTALSTASTAEWVAAAETLCPILWEHAQSIGQSFNDAAGDVSSIEDPDARRDRWRDGLDEMRRLDETLRARLSDISAPLLAPVVAPP